MNKRESNTKTKKKNAVKTFTFWFFSLIFSYQFCGRKLNVIWNRSCVFNALARVRDQAMGCEQANNF